MHKLTPFIFVLFIGYFMFVQPQSSHAQMGSMMGQTQKQSEGSTQQHEEHQTLDQVLPILLERYGVSSIKDIDCNQITDQDFAMAGDAVMEDIHPGEAHEQMDTMMGGEGSSSLETMHIQMGKNYLGCEDFSTNIGMMSRGVGVSMPMMQGYLGQIGWTGNLTSFLLIIDSLLFPVLLIVLIRYFWRRADKK
ncbi:hypothetical protein KC726_01100 [Candidatus Woesebacteria bacterium]|nr:hypothetical protein [Candidatus Woesebacteria bacterium]